MPDFVTSTPISDYQQAVWRLATFECLQKYSPEQIALAVSIVADIFWYSEAKVRLDVARAVKSVSREPKARRRPCGSERRWVA